MKSIKDDIVATFNSSSKDSKRKILRVIMNADLRSLRGEHYIDGDFKWLFINSPQLSFPTDPNHPINVNKGALITVSRTVDTVWSKAYGLVDHYAKELETDVQTILRILLRIVRNTPRGLVRISANEVASNIKVTDTSLIKPYKYAFTVSESSKFDLVFGKSVLDNYIHLYNINVVSNTEKELLGIIERILDVAKTHKQNGITVTPDFRDHIKIYDNLGFKDYSVDGLMAITLK